MKVLNAFYQNLHATPVTLPLLASFRTVIFAYLSTRRRDWLLYNIFLYLYLTLQGIAAPPIQIGYQKLTFSPVSLTFGNEGIYLCQSSFSA